MIDDGGSVFPLFENTRANERGDFYWTGISLRAWFAGRESTYPTKEWLLANYGDSKIVSAFDLPPHLMQEAMARWRFECADAMIAVLKETKP